MPGSAATKQEAADGEQRWARGALRATQHLCALWPAVQARRRPHNSHKPPRASPCAHAGTSRRPGMPGRRPRACMRSTRHSLWSHVTQQCRRCRHVPASLPCCSCSPAAAHCGSGARDSMPHMPVRVNQHQCHCQRGIAMHTARRRQSTRAGWSWRACGRSRPRPCARPRSEWAAAAAAHTKTSAQCALHAHGALHRAAVSARAGCC